jgi:hypothetical protein
MPRSLYPGKDPVIIVQKARWASGQVWTGAKNLAPTGIRFPDRSARGESLYRLHYLGPDSLCTGDKRDQVRPVKGSCEQDDESSRSTRTRTRARPHTHIHTLAFGGLLNRQSACVRACIRIKHAPENNRNFLCATFLLIRKVKSEELPLSTGRMGERRYTSTHSSPRR